MFTSKHKKNIDDREYLGKEEYTILKSPNDILIKYRGFKFATQADLFIYKNQNFVQDNMKWIEVQTFKLFYDKKYYLQCLYIKNINSINKTEIILFSQCYYSNFASSLPFLIDLSNYLKINIIINEFNNKDKKDSNYLDVNILYNYLSRIMFIKKIILLGFSLGNKINMNIMISKINKNSKNKIKAFIFISPTWVYDLSNLKKIKNFSSIKGKVGEFLNEVNKYNIPIFIIHGKQDLDVKYLLSISFSQKINNKLEWYPKKGNHYDIINDYRTKLLLKIKQFLSNNNILKEENNFDILSKLNEYEILDNKNDKDERKTAFFKDKNENQISNGEKNDKEKENNNNSGDDDYYYSHYNNNDIMGMKKKAIENDINKIENKNINNNEDYYTVYNPKIENWVNITINQNLKDYDNKTINQNMKYNDNISINQKIENENNNNNKKTKEYDDISLNNNSIDNDCITINQDVIQYDEEQSSLNKGPRLSIVSFLPGDIIPNFKNKNINYNKNEIYRIPTNSSNRTKSFISFGV